jgi:fatty acid desaturase
MVRELSRLRPWRVVADTATCWSIMVIALVMASIIGTWWACVAAACLVGNRYYALYIIGHDGLHRRLFATSARNDLFCDLFALGPIGAITRINNRNHLRHHQLLATAADPDRHRHGCANKATRLALVGYLTAVTSVWSSVRNVFGRRSEPTTAADEGQRPRYRVRDRAILAGWQVLLFAGLTVLFGWWAYFLLWWVPVFVFAFLGDNLRSFVEHSHRESDEAADEHRLITTDAPWLERQLLAPMNMNFHAAHHLWTSIPYYNLPAADVALRAAPGATGLTWRRSYLGYLWSYARALPIEGCGAATSVA